MAQTYLTINIGSQSKKYSLFGEDGAIIRSAHLEDDHFRDRPEEFFQAAELVVGVRVVAPGEYFQSHHRIDDEYLTNLAAAESLAPLHVGPTRQEILTILERRPGVIVYGLSDSAFYANRPVEAKLYGLPEADAARFGLYRYGYHGLSTASVLRQLNSVPDLKLGRLIICHLGGGVSITALQDTTVVDTSMGFTPLEGPVMSSRVGSIDAAAVLVLLREKKLTEVELESYFNNDCGLKGLSGLTASVRDLLAAEVAGDQNAALALQVFVRGIKKHIGQALALVGGVDTLIFTATIGERSAPIRERVVGELGGLGLQLDLAKNQTVPDPLTQTVTWIQADQSPAKIGVVAADEASQMLTLLKELTHAAGS